MADTHPHTSTDAAAEKAYAAAAEKAAARKDEAAAAKADAQAEKADAQAEKAQADKAHAEKAEAEKEPAPVAVKVIAIEAKPVAVVEVPAESDKPVAAKAARKPAAPKAPAKAELEKAEAKVVKAKKAVKAEADEAAAKPATVLAKLRDSKVAANTRKTADDLSARVQVAVKDAQGRAKSALEKSQALLADVGEFTKGNFEALAASGKILRNGASGIGKAYVENAKSTMNNVKADVKELRTVKSPTEFVKLEVAMVRKYVSTARANSSKSTQAVRKLANEAIKPISNRVTFAVEKVKKAA